MSQYRVKKEYIILLLLLFTFWGSSKIKAQEYRYEVGGALGTSFYMGDANKNALFQKQHFAGGIIFRYNQNFRWSYKANLLAGGVSGDTRSSGNVFPQNQEVAFSRTFVELGGQVEFNFFNYSDKYSYLGTKKLTPYIFTGLGITYGSGKDKFTGLNLPLGIGLKYKIKDRLNLGFEFSFRKLFADNFDVTDKDKFNLDNPYKIDGNVFKNKDWYILTMVTLTWDFGTKCIPCINSLY